MTARTPVIGSRVCVFVASVCACAEIGYEAAELLGIYIYKYMDISPIRTNTRDCRVCIWCSGVCLLFIRVCTLVKCAVQRTRIHYDTTANRWLTGRTADARKMRISAAPATMLNSFNVCHSPIVTGARTVLKCTLSRFGTQHTYAYAVGRSVGNFPIKNSNFY